MKAIFYAIKNGTDYYFAESSRGTIKFTCELNRIKLFATKEEAESLVDIMGLRDLEVKKVTLAMEE